jgi:hypothetical protein
VVRVNKAGGRINSVSIDRNTQRGGRHWSRIWAYEDLKMWKETEPTAEDFLVKEKAEEPDPVLVQDDPEREAAEALAEAIGEVEVVTNHDPDFYPTSRDVVSYLVRLADLKPGMLCLEPSAGDGRIVEAMRGEGRTVECCETNYNAQRVLQSKGYTLVGDDFLGYQPDHLYDVVIMNPPFSNQQDIDHVRHAYDLLKGGGRLVAVMSEGTFYRDTKKARDFRAWLYGEADASDEPLPEGAFAEAGTMVKTRVVVVDKPVSVEAEPTSEAMAQPVMF